MLPSAAGPLQAAEWIKYLALFFNKDAAAEQQFNATAAAYNATAGQYSSGSRAPVVAWISRVSSGGDQAFEVQSSPCLPACWR